MDLSYPQVMGILNVTPDSFYANSRKQTEAEIAARAHQITEEGGSLIDIGAYSSRPNAEHISAEEEMARLRRGLEVVRRELPDAVISVDTFRADVARMCVEEYGAAIINDIAGGNMDADMFPTVARLGVPYVMMHMQGTPQNMQQAPHYENVTKEVMLYFAQKVQQLRDLGAKDIILDPGFGFGTGQNGRAANIRTARPCRRIAQINDLQTAWRNTGRCPERNKHHQHHCTDERSGHLACTRCKSCRGSRPNHDRNEKT